MFNDSISFEACDTGFEARDRSLKLVASLTISAIIVAIKHVWHESGIHTRHVIVVSLLVVATPAASFFGTAPPPIAPSVAPIKPRPFDLPW